MEKRKHETEQYDIRKKKHANDKKGTLATENSRGNKKLSLLVVKHGDVRQACVAIPNLLIVTEDGFFKHIVKKCRF